MFGHGELGRFLWIVLCTVFVAVPVILHKIRLPRKLQVDILTDPQLTPDQKKFVASYDVRLKELGYAPIVTYRLANIPGSKNLLRTYLSSIDPTRCTVQISGVTKGPVQFEQVQFVTEFADKSRTFTTNRTTSQTFEVEPGRFLQECPGLQDLAELKRRHQQFTEPYMVRGPVFMDTNNFLAKTQEQYDRETSHQLNQKLLRLDAAKNEYRVTLKWALRMQKNFWNPFADGFTLSRLAGAVAIAAVPLLARMAQTNSALAPWGQSPLSMVTIAYAVAGIAAGLLFGHKGFVWAFLLAYIPTLLLPSPASNTLGMSLVTAWIAYFTFQVHGRSKRLV